MQSKQDAAIDMHVVCSVLTHVDRWFNHVQAVMLIHVG